MNNDLMNKMQSILANASKGGGYEEDFIKDQPENKKKDVLEQIKEDLLELYEDLQSWECFTDIEISTEDFPKMGNTTKPINLIKLILNLVGKKLKEIIPKKDTLDF